MGQAEGEIELRITRWSELAAPSEKQLRLVMQEEGLAPYSWSNGPFDRYEAHSHAFNKVIYVVRGAIAFGLPKEGLTLSLKAGDRLELPAGTLHDAAVGAEGVLCLEAHRGTME